MLRLPKQYLHINKSNRIARPGVDASKVGIRWWATGMHKNTRVTGQTANEQIGKADRFIITSCYNTAVYQQWGITDVYFWKHAHVSQSEVKSQIHKFHSSKNKKQIEEGLVL